MKLALHSYWRSSASHRVRIALELKGLGYQYLPVHLLRDGGQQHDDSYRAINPQQRVPTLLAGDTVLTQSLAICEWLEERYPQPALLPADADGRARVRSLALIFIADVQPLQNLMVLDYLRQRAGFEQAAIRGWLGEWIGRGLAACEVRLRGERHTGRFCHGDLPGLADLSLMAQLAGARRYSIDLTAYPTILRIEAACAALPAFQRAAPERQPDAEL